MRIAIGAIAHESSSFTPVATPYEAFSETGRGLLRGDEIIDVHHGVNSGAGGFIAGAEEFDFELAPVLWTFAEPSAPVESDAWRRLKGEFLERLASLGPVDGVLLDLHGAMVIEDVEDGEGDLLSGIREVIGDGPPVISTLDLHGNITQRMCDAATALIPCDNYPHTDFLERGLEASEMIVGTLRGELSPVMAWRQLPMLWTGGQFTGREPFDSIIARAHALEAQPGILTASVAPGFPWADIHDAGASVIVVADRDAALARREADALGGWIYAQRELFLPDLDSWDEALRTARAVNRWPAVFGDPQDNPGGGAPGDSVGMLRAFLDAGLTNALIVTLCDPEVVGIAQQAGEGAEITVDIGGKSAPDQGPPVRATAVVERLLDLRFSISGPMYTGMVQDFGPSVLLRIGGVHVAVTTLRMQVFDLEGPRMLGFEPERLSWIGVKSANHFRGAYEPIAGSVHRVAFPAQHRFDPREHRYTRLRRPIWPLDEVAL
ncbi:MAG: M81 family metallopeptidase [Chloroflexi bacterium]|nr:M81 family metallopeptidase [Chloroflexota bacterium]